MATYTTSDELTAQYGAEQILIAADRDGDGSADTDVITTAIANASNEIDSYLSVRYDLPLTTTPDVLVPIANVLAMYHMSSNTGTLTDDKERRYDKAVAWLTKLSKGHVDLGTSEGQEVVPDVPTMADETQARVFTRTRLVGLF